MRVGIVILPDERWSVAARRWRRAEEYGFHHAFTYDHLGWRSLVDGPWFDAVGTLAAAAAVTSRIRLGPLVASPNFRHPVAFARQVTTLDDLSGGRLTLGVGAGGVGFDADVLGERPLTPGERVGRFGEFLAVLDGLLTHDRFDHQGRWYTAVDARSTPGCVQRPRVPFLVAANGPRALGLAARYGQAWVTAGSGGSTEDEWWRAVAGTAERFTEALAQAGRDPSTVDRFLQVDAAPVFSLSSVDAFADAVGRAAELGFTDLVTHWPRRSGWYAGDESILEAVAAEILPRL
jgi:alkanesulfonate monooxygenase SsuD/methylene tetrahydromethanopterin reductase-like flavin-dependent oxidoreductase (luciferase family)